MFFDVYALAPLAAPFPFALLRRLLTRDLQNVNLLNMYCNILHTLAPIPGALGNYADRLFQAVLSHAQSVQSGSTALIEDPTGEAGHQWLYDAMSDLIQATLNNDPSLDRTVRDDLMKDLTGLQTELGIDATQEAKVQARIILAQTNVLILNMAKWMSALASVGSGIATALSKLWGMSGFSLSGSIFARAAQACSEVTLSASKIALMKGMGILVMVSHPPATRLLVLSHHPRPCISAMICMAWLEG